MSYNIQHGEGLDEVVSLSRIAKIIQQAQAGIIGIQEIDKFFDERSAFQNQPQQLADILQFNYTFGANLSYPPGEGQKEEREYGTAIFSRYQILESENIHLTSSDEEQRGILRAKIDVGGTHLYVYNTHLGLDKASRIQQIKEVIELIKERKGPFILMGDFNVEPESEEIKFIENNLAANEVLNSIPNAFTYSSIEPTSQIDYIYTSAELKYANPQVLQVDGSDHLPILTEVTLK